MSMFRRPTDESSESETDSGDDEEPSHNRSQGEAEETLWSELAATETLSSGESISVSNSRSDHVAADVDHHKNMMLASLLEDFYRTRAAELMNSADSRLNYHRGSPEVQNLARSLFARASRTLAVGGLLPFSATSHSGDRVRKQYLMGLEGIGLQNLQDEDLLPQSLSRSLSGVELNGIEVVKANELITRPNMQIPDALQQLAIRTSNISLMNSPADDMQLTAKSPQPSHYKSSFQEVRLLGKGGFGRVYHTYNRFDNKEYAVKKIPLSPTLSQRYREKGHEELRGILREVQALAAFEHCNVVRYHATWIEDPIMIGAVGPRISTLLQEQPHRRLLADRPIFPSTKYNEMQRMFLQPGDHVSHADVSDGIRFETEDTRNEIPAHFGPLWSFKSNNQPIGPVSKTDTDIFTDGLAGGPSYSKQIDDPYCYVLHVQMSMYPMTLTQFLQPIKGDVRRGSGTAVRRHCFHLIPSLKIFLGLLSGVQYVHARGYIHRDIKPGNVFLDQYDFSRSHVIPDGYEDVGNCPACRFQDPFLVNPRIGDFGLVAELARHTDNSTSPSNSSSGGMAGTEYYRPPTAGSAKNRAISQAIDEKLDVFALGVVLVEMLWQCDTAMERMDLLQGVQRGKIPRSLTASIEAEGYGVDIARSVENCIMGMIDHDPKSRWTCTMTKEYIEEILRAIPIDHLT